MAGIDGALKHERVQSMRLPSAAIRSFFTVSADRARRTARREKYKSTNQIGFYLTATGVGLFDTPNNPETISDRLWEEWRLNTYVVNDAYLSGNSFSQRGGGGGAGGANRLSLLAVVAQERVEPHKILHDVPTIGPLSYIMSDYDSAVKVHATLAFSSPTRMTSQRFRSRQYHLFSIRKPPRTHNRAERRQPSEESSTSEESRSRLSNDTTSREAPPANEYPVSAVVSKARTRLFGFLQEANVVAVVPKTPTAAAVTTPKTNLPITASSDSLSFFQSGRSYYDTLIPTGWSDEEERRFTLESPDVIWEPDICKVIGSAKRAHVPEHITVLISSTKKTIKVQETGVSSQDDGTGTMPIEALRIKTFEDSSYNAESVIQDETLNVAHGMDDQPGKADDHIGLLLPQTIPTRFLSRNHSRSYKLRERAASSIQRHFRISRVRARLRQAISQTLTRSARDRGHRVVNKLQQQRNADVLAALGRFQTALAQADCQFDFFVSYEDYRKKFQKNTPNEPTFQTEKAVLKAQSLWRGTSFRWKVALRWRGILRLQAWVRGVTARVCYHHKRRAIICLQKTQRNFMVQASLARVTARLTKQLGDKRRALAASSIQNFWRCVHPKVKLRRVRIHQSLGRALHTRQQNAAQTIGRAIRGWAVRVRYKRLNKSARALQAVARRNNVYRRIKKEISALLIQRFCHRIWLRIAIRRHLILLAFGRDPKTRRHNAAVSVQRRHRGRWSKRHFQVVVRSVVAIQAARRRHKAVVELRDSIRGCCTIQNAWRQVTARKRIGDYGPEELAPMCCDTSFARRDRTV
ncbi:predicted protein [Phaeodactylum tricornutum CCAP 1055/1]|uniref:Uncharacterized protein n=1 Tax=Phaeodactylum tricornutum (strain CCAP 1055/1) TaxID=556484 RepID=B7FYU8_PHATC|nr:predicted protein [Phaeodactylum tricornutum CCAP 1055/1]EEC48422.1 predicted protein [Phaeodactylum tricornutum CCAP 1055/1]|eukprot:XP_002180231.1 predicted protein [Phaeodactylum tricornutum CCAP 1055/1]